MRRMFHSAGFTLVELVIVLVLLGILAIAIIPRAPSKGSLTLTGQAHQLASDIRYVQSLSMTRGQRFCFRLTPTGYNMTTTAANACTATPTEHPAGRALPVSLDGLSVNSTLPAGDVIFNGKGAPYADATTALAANAVITLSGEGGTKTVTISPVTGRVVVDP
jgi:MSHA pilin protein MshC